MPICENKKVGFVSIEKEKPLISQGLVYLTYTKPM